ncbi:MAG: hypothetical protein Tsb0017_01710 [Geothermobacteraceae bacterium]
MKKQQLLMLLMVGLVVAGVYAWLASPRQERVSQVARTEQAARRVATESRRIGEALRLDLLERDAGAGSAVKRDIFNFYVKPAPKPVAKPAPAPAPKPVVTRPAPPPVPVQTEPPPTRFRLLGLVDTGKDRKVFLTEEKHLFIVSEGDTFGAGGEYSVESLDDEEIVIRQKGRTATIRVSLAEKVAGEPGTENNPAVRGVPTRPRQVVPERRMQFKSFKKYQP